jgi:hypothetical protein
MSRRRKENVWTCLVGLRDGYNTIFNHGLHNVIVVKDGGVGKL